MNELYTMGWKLNSGQAQAVAQARRQLARFRRSLTEDRYIDDVYDVLLKFERIPAAHEGPCLLIGGLYALHPDNGTSSPKRWPLCAALAESSSAEARVRQLIGASQTSNEALEHYLRQAVRLVSRAPEQRPLDYNQLLWDLIHLSSGDETRARPVRRRWARDFRHQVHTSQTSDKKDAT
ncbi:type I-E CRISPR-associated protein Cse2/CasB [Nocardiopsis coralli]|uniref:type I-E CRISPR-associated protein Cse2/CasB n=1 Tax=Nocardiopsis coralli TaxID=2772213 RepID=UPI001C111E30|nr:type I-E CRISPR-associated protein Cse2/CasB [Nocardiopsis coralli]